MLKVLCSMTLRDNDENFFHVLFHINNLHRRNYIGTEMLGVIGSVTFSLSDC